MAEKLTPKPARAFEGVADPAYLGSEIEQLRDIAREAGLGTLEYLLECAAIEARALIAAKDRGDYDAPAGRHDGRHQRSLPHAKLCQPTAPLPSLAYS